MVSSTSSAESIALKLHAKRDDLDEEIKYSQDIKYVRNSCCYLLLRKYDVAQ